MNITLRPARPADAEEMTRWFADEADLAQWAGPDIDFPLTTRRLYERAGFVHEGTARDTSHVPGRRYSMDTMSLLRPEWRPEWVKTARTAVVA